MNFLAHAFLSLNDDDEWMVGNLLGDFVKGKKQFSQLPFGVQQGVLLHRQIDKFTDRHPIVKQGVQRLRPYHDRYATVALDIIYDYFLANNWETYSDQSLEDFSNSIYGKLEPHLSLFPPKVIKQFRNMIDSNWLIQYKSEERLQWVFERLKKRVKFESHFEDAVQNMLQHKVVFNKEFNLFFPQLIEESNRKINALRSTKAS